MKSSSDFSISDCVYIVIALALLGFVIYGFFAPGPEPDESVLRAAQSMTAQPVVSRGSQAFIGCSEGDIYRFEVKDKDGNYVGYVCKGWLTKGATPRY